MTLQPTRFGMTPPPGSPSTTRIPSSPTRPPDDYWVRCFGKEWGNNGELRHVFTASPVMSELMLDNYSQGKIEKASERAKALPYESSRKEQQLITEALKTLEPAIQAKLNPTLLDQVFTFTSHNGHTQVINQLLEIPGFQDRLKAKINEWEAPIQTDLLKLAQKMIGQEILEPTEHLAQPGKSHLASREKARRDSYWRFNEHDSWVPFYPPQNIKRWPVKVGFDPNFHAYDQAINDYFLKDLASRTVKQPVQSILPRILRTVNDENRNLTSTLLQTDKIKNDASFLAEELVRAIEREDENAIRLLLEKAHLNENPQALAQALGMWNKQIANHILEKTNVKKNPQALAQALRIASYSGHEPITRLLLDETNVKENPQAVAEALLIASYDGHEPIARLLLDETNVKENPQAVAEALKRACRFGYEPITRHLLEKTNLNENPQALAQALETACLNLHEPIVHLLLKEPILRDTPTAIKSALELTKAVRERGYNPLIKVKCKLIEKALREALPPSKLASFFKKVILR